MKEFIKQILKEYYNQNLGETIFEFIQQFSDTEFKTFIDYAHMGFDEPGYLLKIKYHVSKVNAWKKDFPSDYDYHATAYIVIDYAEICDGIPESVGNCKQIYYLDDIPEYVFDNESEFGEQIKESVRKFFNTDLDFDFTFPKK